MSTTPHTPERTPDEHPRGMKGEGKRDACATEACATGEARVLVTWAEVMSLCRRASVGEHTARKMFCRVDSEARIVLRGTAMARYNRAMVLRDLGLASETTGAGDTSGNL